MQAVSIGVCTKPEDCRLPAGAQVLAYKYCEVCGRPFVREFAPTEVYQVRSYRLYSVAGFSEEHPAELRRDHGDKFCRDCRGRQLQPDVAGAERYLAQMPGTRRQMGRSTGVPKYDLPPKGPRLPRQRMMEEAQIWKARVRAEFAAKGQLTAAEIQEFIPRCFTPVDAYSRCYGAGLRLRRVGYVAPQGFGGRPARIYVLSETIQ